MRRKLNPDLVRIRYAGADDSWVFLRDPEYTAVGREEGIGPMLIEATPESDADSQAFRQQVKETFTALNALAGVPPERVPTVIVTEDCFGFKGTVRVVIYSDNPFS